MTTKLYDLSQPFGWMDTLWPRVGHRQERALERLQCHNCSSPGRPTRQVSITWDVWRNGTHLEAPSTEVDGGPTVDKVPLERCYGTGVVVDFRYMKKWSNITAEDFEKHQPKIEPGDIVIVNTGWDRYYRTNDYVYWNQYPGLVRSGAEWLVKKKVKLVGGTWGCRDHPLSHKPVERTMPPLYVEYTKETGKDPAKEYPEYEICHYIISSNGIPVIERVGGDIDKVSGKRCTVAAFPFRLEGTGGALVRLVAIVEE